MYYFSYACISLNDSIFCVGKAYRSKQIHLVDNFTEMVHNTNRVS